MQPCTVIPITAVELEIRIASELEGFVSGKALHSSVQARSWAIARAASKVADHLPGHANVAQVHAPEVRKQCWLQGYSIWIGRWDRC